MISDSDSAALKAAQARLEMHRRAAQRVRQRHERWLMSLTNVNGVSVEAEPDTGLCVIVAYVERKVPRAELSPHDVIPADLDGVPVRVEEIGPVMAQDGPP